MLDHARQNAVDETPRVLGTEGLGDVHGLRYRNGEGHGALQEPLEHGKAEYGAVHGDDTLRPPSRNHAQEDGIRFAAAIPGPSGQESQILLDLGKIGLRNAPLAAKQIQGHVDALVGPVAQRIQKLNREFSGAAPSL